MLAAGEIGIACDVASNGGVSAAASPSTYLVGWTELSPPTRSDVVVRRFDVNGAPLDSGRTVLSTDVPCHSSHSSLALASDGKDFYAVWRSLGSTEGDTYFYIDMLGRRVGGSGGVGALDHLDLLIPRGTCQVAYDGPTMAAGVWSRRFSVGWQEYGSCYGSLDFQYPIARVVDLNNMPVSQSLDIGFTPPTGSSVVGPQSGASVAQLGSDTLGADTLWVWHASRSTYPEPSSEHFVTGVFGDLDGADPQVVLSHRNELIGGRPGVAAGASSFLVAWAQGASDDATTVTEIRAVRATRAYPVPRLDPDGGLLLATSSTVITGGPVVAADATRWLVVWAEKSGATNDLRAVAVESDGTVVDASPRLVASDVTAGEPAVASGGGMRVLVVFSRPNGATRDVLAKPLTP
jgi:hypothetical protein